MTFNWWMVLGWAIGLIGIGYAVRTNQHRRNEVLHRQQRFEWVHVQQGVHQLCKWLRSDRFVPDLLVGVPGAGVLLIELAAIELGETLPIIMIQQKPKDDSTPFPFSGGREFATKKWRYYIPADLLALKGAKVLVLDDYAQSGDTLVELKGTLVAAGFAPENISTAALISVRGLRESAKAPDRSWFWVDTFDVHMPWGHASKKIRTGTIDVP